MSSKEATEACLDKIKSENIYAFAADNITPSDVGAFSNMTVWYYSTLETSLINFFVIIHANSLSMVLKYIDQKRFASSDLCNVGSFVGIFLIQTDDVETQMLTKMALPINFNGNQSHDFFLNNVKLLLEKTYSTVNGSECGDLVSGLTSSSSDDRIQHNIMFFDYLKPCFDFRWNKTKVNTLREN